VKSTQKRLLFICGGFTFSVMLFFVLAEILLRVAGYTPWKTFTRFDNEPSVHEPDPTRGWRNKPGKYVFPPYAPGGEKILMTFLPDGSRSTGKSPTNSNTKKKIIFTGGSFTQGWAISDDQTMAWKTQLNFPETQVKNWGVGGYGTVQTLLTLMAKSDEITDNTTVFYGLIEHHEDRNVAPGYWLEALSRYSKRGHVALPWASLDANGELLFHPPESYPHYPFHEYSATITVMEKASVLIKTADRSTNKREILEKLILKMNSIVKNKKGRFIVVLFDGSRNFMKRTSEFLQQNGIECLNCSYKITNKFKVPGEGHPNGKLNTIWAKDVKTIISQ
jgi:DNA-directed RNA polymerase subunit RPC12/RpoP